MTPRELLERSHLLDALERYVDDAGRGRGRLVFVHGEAGVGKTVLLRRLCSMADRTVWGICEELRTPRALGPLVDVAASVGGELEQLVEHGAKLHDVLPAVLRELRAQPRTVVIVEDVHWADEATLDLLRLLARRIDDTPALVVASLRDDGLDRSHPVRVLLGDLATARAVERLKLEPLSLTAVRKLAVPYGADEVALYRKTGGNPFFVTEVLDAGGVHIPDTVRDAVLAHAARMPAPAGRLLEAVAIAPARVELWLLEALAEDELPQLEACLVSGMLEHDEGRVAFRHELARQAIEEAMSPDRRLELHRAALRALAAPVAGAPDPARLAHHAEAAGDAEAVLRYAPIAGARAASLGAHVEAAAQFDRALRFAGGLSLARQAHLYERRAMECYLTDQPDEALAAGLEALARHRSLGSRAKEADTLRFVSRLLWYVGRFDEAEEAGREAVALLETLPPGPELAMAYSNRAHLAMMAQRTTEAVAWGAKAVEHAERLGAPRILAHALNNMGTAEFRAGSLEGRAKLERSLALAREAGSEEHVSRALVNLGGTALDLRSYAAASRYLDEAIEYTADRDLGPKHGYVLALRARCDLEQGRWAEAEEAAEAVLRPARAIAQARIAALVVLGRLRARRGEAGVWPALDEARARAEELQLSGPVVAARAEAAWLEQRLDTVRDDTAAAFALARERGDDWLAGELAYWRFKAGVEEETPRCAAQPFARQIAGDWESAAARWTEIGCPYEAALALAEADDKATLRRAQAALLELGAQAAARLVAQRLRARGARRVARGPRPATRENPANLTPRQLEVLVLVAEGLQNTEIAARLVVSPKTVDHHVSAILAKLGVSSRREAGVEAVRLGVSPQA